MCPQTKAAHVAAGLRDFPDFAQYLSSRSNCSNRNPVNVSTHTRSTLNTPAIHQMPSSQPCAT